MSTRGARAANRRANEAAEAAEAARAAAERAAEDEAAGGQRRPASPDRERSRDRDRSPERRGSRGRSRSRERSPQVTISLAQLKAVVADGVKLGKNEGLHVGRAPQKNAVLQCVHKAAVHLENAKTDGDRGEWLICFLQSHSLLLLRFGIGAQLRRAVWGSVVGATAAAGGCRQESSELV